MSVPRYLQAGFDPMTIKMDSIREILIHHKIKPPTGEVRKQDLVDLFELHIRPRVIELRKPYERAVHAQEIANANKKELLSRSKQTISQTSIQPESHRVIPKSAAIATSVAQPTRQEKPAALLSSTSSMSSSSSRRRESRTSEPSHADEDLEKSEELRRRRSNYNDNFSDENPFQSGNESERRRRSKSKEPSKTSGSSRNSSTNRKSRRKSRDYEIRMDNDHIFKIPPQPVFSKHMTTPKYTIASTYDRAESDSGPFHNSPLYAKTKRMSISTHSPPSPKIIQYQSAINTYGTRPKRSLDNNRSNQGLLRSIFLLALLSYGLWFRQTRIDIGYCTTSTYITAPSSHDLLTTKQWLMKRLYPTCIPCPDHATCSSSNTDPICPPEYILQPHPLSFGGLIPLSPNCILNKAQEYQSLQVADAAETLLHRRAGQEECRSSTRPQPNEELFVRQRFSVNKLRNEIEILKDDSVSEEDFNQYWMLALDELCRRPSTILVEETTR
ncbi:inner nuclear membrane protein enriched at telomere/subtelomere region [Linnemannia zychae]|nr:inner nuclear membrane protein enriched at telomere/subtelomere region [Linnemannia zychae]